MIDVSKKLPEIVAEKLNEYHRKRKFNKSFQLDVTELSDFEIETLKFCIGYSHTCIEDWYDGARYLIFQEDE